MDREKHTPLSTRIAALVHAHFDALPARYKPRTRDDGSREWIPMSGFVIVQGMLMPFDSVQDTASRHQSMKLRASCFGKTVYHLFWFWVTGNSSVCVNN